MTVETELREIKKQKNDFIVVLENKAIQNAGNQFEERDVIDGNRVLPFLPQMIKEGDLNAIRVGADRMAGNVLEMDMNNLSPEELLIAHRDMGIIGTADTLITPHDEEPEMRPKVARAMQKCSSYTGIVPRNVDTVYGGEHSRNFTSDTFILKGNLVSRELFFRLAVEMAVGEQEGITSDMRIAMESDIQDPEFTYSLVDANQRFAKMNASMITANEYIAKDGYFRKLIKFLEGYKVSGVMYEHSGSQLAGMLALDNALGIVKSEDFEPLTSDVNRDQVDSVRSGYWKYFPKNLKYAGYKPDMLNDILAIRDRAQGGSVIDRFRSTEPSKVPQDALIAFKSLVGSIHTFRSVHTSSMERTFSERPDSVKYGSAGTMQIARDLRTRTSDFLKQTQTL